MKSFLPNDKGGHGSQDGTADDSRGEKCSNPTHSSRTDPEARLYRKGKGKPAQLCYMGHALMENRDGLAIGAHLTQANGTAEREAALRLIMLGFSGRR
jgi:hypothetical protein